MIIDKWKMENGKWLFGIAAGIILAVLAVYPQMNLQRLRGADFKGAFASCDLDEMAYASYLQALIDGRPRKNDPYTGRDASADSPQPESLFSIQFFPAYLVAVPARILGCSASEIMPVVSFVSAFLAALSLFWLIVSMTEDALLAAVGTLVVMFGSALVVGIGAINGFYENGAAYPFFPFMRRYIPSLAFPFMFAFFACLWNGLQSSTRKKRAIYSALASLCFAALVFSYFYVWTAAAAVLFGIVLFVMLFRSENWRDDFLFLAITGAFCLFALVPYALLLANRNETMDKAQLLVFTRQVDFLRTVEVIGYIVLTVTAFALWSRYTKLEDRKAYFIAAFALAPFLVFNQQILTGRSLQPFHYEFYVINYVVLLSVVLIVAVFWQRFGNAVVPAAVLSASRAQSGERDAHRSASETLALRQNRISIQAHRKTASTFALSILGLLSIGWGYIEARDTTVYWDSINVRRDEAMPVNLHLRELAGENVEGAKRQTTLNLEAIQADSQPTVAPQAVLWARHQHVFAGLEDWEENKQRYYRMLYYSNLNADFLRRALTGCQDIEACMALFGWDRFNARLSANARPLTFGEIEEEVRRYDAFYKNFSIAQASHPTLSFVVVLNNANSDLSNLERWYQLDAGEKFGAYTLYKVRLKN